MSLDQVTMMHQEPLTSLVPTEPLVSPMPLDVSGANAWLLPLNSFVHLDKPHALPHQMTGTQQPSRQSVSRAVVQQALTCTFLALSAVGPL